MNSDSLKYVLREFADRPLPESRSRELSLPTDSGKVIGLSGVRRCGKTFLFFDTIRHLVADGVDRRRIVYLNFEDDRLQPVQSADFDLVLRCLREVFPQAATGRLYLFLDEQSDRFAICAVRCWTACFASLAPGTVCPQNW